MCRRAGASLFTLLSRCIRSTLTGFNGDRPISAFWLNKIDYENEDEDEDEKTAGRKKRSWTSGGLNPPAQPGPRAGAPVSPAIPPTVSDVRAERSVALSV